MNLNETMTTFGYPETCVAEYDHWVVLLRRQQVTLGSLVLVCRGSATRFSDIDAAAFAELSDVIKAIESTLAGQFNYEKINYLMLMMVDPHVHFHVIPRYREPQRFGDIEIVDEGWPGPPALAAAVNLSADAEIEMIEKLRARFTR